MLNAGGRIEPATRQSKAYVLAHVQMREQGVVLKQIGNIARLRRQINTRPGIKKPDIAQTNMAAVGRHQTGQRLERLALARTGGPHDDNALMVRAQLHVQVKGALSRAQRFADVDVKLHGLPPLPVHDSARGQPACRQQCHHAHGRGDQHQGMGHIVLPGLNRFIYRN